MERNERYITNITYELSFRVKESHLCLANETVEVVDGASVEDVGVMGMFY